MRTTTIWTALLVLLASAGMAPARAQRASLAVTITEPSAGTLDGDYTVNLAARVSDPRVSTALLSVNGAVYEVPVKGGRIEQTVVVVPGNNRVAVVATRGREVARDSVTFYLRGERTDLVVLLTWAARGEIIDLWVREPDGETCKWDHRETRSRGRLLDFSQDAIGFGSQAFVLPTISPGRYRIKVHYWGAYGRDDDRSRWAYDELIGRLDELDDRLARVTARPGPLAAPWSEYRRLPGGEAPHFTLTRAAADHQAARAEHARLLRRIDRWATPAAPQTPVRGEAMLFPGTRHERRWRFSLTAQRTGQLVALGEVEVTAAMIQAARAGGPGTRRP